MDGNVPPMKIHHPRDYALMLAAFVDVLGANLPQIASECAAFSELLRRTAGPEASAGPSEPPSP